MSDRDYTVAEFRRFMFYTMIAMEKLQNHKESTRLEYNVYCNMWDHMNRIKELFQDLEDTKE